MSWRGVLAYCTWPFVMAASVGTAIWGIEAGYDPGTWAFAVSVANFNLVVLFEILLPRKSGVSLIRDRQSLNDIGHGVVVAGLARPLASASSASMAAVPHLHLYLHLHLLLDSSRLDSTRYPYKKPKT